VVVPTQEADVASELVDDELTDHQPQPDAVLVNLSPLVLDRAKELEEFVLVLLLDAESRVHH